MQVNCVSTIKMAVHVSKLFICAQFLAERVKTFHGYVFKYDVDITETRTELPNYGNNEKMVCLYQILSESVFEFNTCIHDLN